MPTVDFHLYLITDRHQCRDRPFTGVLREACQAGVKAVQLREKDLTPLATFRLAAELNMLLDGFETALLMNDRADIAMAVGARGVHLPEVGIPVEAARRCLSSGTLVGVSTHSRDGAIRAQEDGADFITFGPIFFTPSKAPYGEPLGLRALEEVAQDIRLPIFAIGGITPDRVKNCLTAGAWGVAVISAILAAEKIDVAVAAFREALGEL
ncbi:MAG: thiamine phosphate synthase [Candidatus Latescibacteria bacterium]|nr:thiamine phosphate synthase [Candidatus Latescibacterota bacterium]